MLLFSASAFSQALLVKYDSFSGIKLMSENSITKIEEALGKTELFKMNQLEAHREFGLCYKDSSSGIFIIFTNDGHQLVSIRLRNSNIHNYPCKIIEINDKSININGLYLGANISEYIEKLNIDKYQHNSTVIHIETEYFLSPENKYYSKESVNQSVYEEFNLREVRHILSIYFQESKASEIVVYKYANN